MGERIVFSTNAEEKPFNKWCCNGNSQDAPPLMNGLRKCGILSLTK
jgi:hypothetical protein